MSKQQHKLDLVSHELREAKSELVDTFTTQTVLDQKEMMQKNNNEQFQVKKPKKGSKKELEAKI